MYSPIAIFLLFVAAAQAQRAIVVFTTGGNGVRGNVTFTQNGDKVTIEGNVEGLTPGRHGFHIHEKGDLSSGCASTGGHFNPYKKHHGGPGDADRHVGDLGNIEADHSGSAVFSIADHLISLKGDNSIVGRGVVIHSDADDYGKGGFSDSLTTGHAGSRVACGVIGTLELGVYKPSKSSVGSGASKLIAFSILPFGLLQIIHRLF